MAVGSALTLADVDDIAKTVYSPRRLEALALGKRPLLNWMPKQEYMGGQGYACSIWYEDPQSVGYDLATLITNVDSTKQERFLVDDTKFAGLYGVVAISGRALLGTRSSMFSYLKAKDMNVAGMMRQLGKRLHAALYGDGNGWVAQISSIADTVITLTNKSDVNMIGKGAMLVADNDATGASPKNSGTSVQVSGTNRSNGTITMASDVDSAPHSWAANDYLFFEGDEGTVSGGGKINGLAAWLPTTTTSATSFYDVDRTQDAGRLFGKVVDNSGQQIRQSLTELGTLIAEGEAQPDAVFIHPLAGNVLADELGAQVTRQDGKEANFEFTGFKLQHFIAGPIEFIFDWACPVNRAYMLTKSTWELVHMGELPHIITDDGKMANRSATADQIELRGRLFAQPVCHWPGANGVATISLPS